MVQPSSGQAPGDETVPAPAQPPVTATDGVAEAGTRNGAASGRDASTFQPPLNVNGRAGGPLLPPEWPRPLDPSPFALEAIEEEAQTAEAGPGADVWYVDPVDDPANWGPPLPPPPPPARSVWEVLWPWGVRGVVETVEVLALALLMFLFVRSIGQNFVVDGGSMEPTFHNGEMLIVNKVVYRSFDLSWVSGPAEWRPFGQPAAGDIVVFRFPQDPRRDFIKRVIAVPGQTVEVCGGTVYIDGTARPEPYLARPAAYEYGPVTVPQGQYFVLGDNRNNSYDSHSWGMLGESFMIGRAEVRYWPLERAGRIEHESPAPPQAGVLRFP